MAGTSKRPHLHVEGRDDLFAVSNLMCAYGVDYDAKPWPPTYPEIKEIGSVEELLKGMKVAIKAASSNVIGFVFDADESVENRWEAVRSQLSTVDVDSPEKPPPEGFVGFSDRLQARVGVWLMPDNVHEGVLEDFLLELIDQGDRLIAHAQSSTDEAKSHGAAFRDIARIKAVVHCWLAWQEEPGLPFGTAVRAKYFRPDLPAGKRFAEWFCNLFELPIVSNA